MPKKKKRHHKKRPSGIVLELKPTDVLDDMKNFKKIGEGKSGFTAIYEARTKAGGELALKLFTCTNHPQRAIRYEKFVNETLILKKLEDHPHILKAHNEKAKKEGKHNGKKVKIDYFAMELLAGSLSDYIEASLENQSLWSMSSKIEVLLQVCAALEHAHEHDIYHRDLYSDNILLVEFAEPLHAKLTDFGSAKSPAFKSQIMYQHPLGAFNFSSPEIMSGLSDNNGLWMKADVFSLGLLIYDVVSDSRHPLEAVLPRIPPITDPNIPKSEKEAHLNNLVIPYLQSIAYRPIILAEAMKKRDEVEQNINQIVVDATHLNHTDRIANVGEVKSKLEKCKELINA